jgi:F0F1-type ATP synthase assembly protein I
MRLIKKHWRSVKTMVSFILGIIIGATFGLITASLMAANGDDDE